MQTHELNYNECSIFTIELKLLTRDKHYSLLNQIVNEKFITMTREQKVLQLSHGRLTKGVRSSTVDLLPRIASFPND